MFYLELTLCALLAAVLIPITIKCWRFLDGVLVLDAVRPSAADVAAAEAELPDMRDLHGLNATDIEFMHAVDDFRAMVREDAA